jgi:hypothetical protein
MKKSSRLSQNTQNVTTIDEYHNQLLLQFQEIETKTIPDLLKKKKYYLKHMKSFNNLNIDKYLDNRDAIKEINKEIATLRKKKKDYLLNNAKYIFEYFEEKKKIASGKNNQNVNKVQSFFKIKTDEEQNTNNLSKETGKIKQIYQKYWKNVRNEIANIQDFVVPTDICQYCRKGELIVQEDEGIYICNNQLCGRFVTAIIESSKPLNKEPPNEVSYTAYIRLNHFKEILSQFQAKETTQIPDEVIQAIRNRIKKERIIDKKELTYNKMREILSNLDLTRYFEHIQYINSLFGIKPPVMSEELHETLCVLFIEIQQPWAIHCPPGRTNFFSYAYTLYQLCVLLDQTQYLPYIPLLKDRTKQIEQDMIWKKVCDTLGWCFIPTV